ncbi:MAG: hypothetical protein RL272_1073 [Candidatus Parcubacteria bacterium]|jgi:hypothetical protein
MKTITALFSALLCIGAAACATANSASGTPAPETAAAAPATPAREPGTMVVRRPLVEVGTADLLAPIPVPADAAAVVERSPGTATSTSTPCDAAPGGVRVSNATEFPVALTVDGEPVTVIGTVTISRFIGPRTSAFLCLDPSRGHVFDGFALRESNGRLFAIPNRFRAEVPMAAGGQATYTVSYALIAGGR